MGAVFGNIAEAEGSNVAVTLATERAQAAVFTATPGGLLAALKWKMGSAASTAKTLKIYICKWNGALTPPGEVLATASYSQAEAIAGKATILVEGFTPLAMVNEQKYWLVVIPQDGSFKPEWAKEKAGESVIGGGGTGEHVAKIKTLAEVTGWGPNTEHGPFWAVEGITAPIYTHSSMGARSSVSVTRTGQTAGASSIGASSTAAAGHKVEAGTSTGVRSNATPERRGAATASSTVGLDSEVEIFRVGNQTNKYYGAPGEEAPEKALAEPLKYETPARFLDIYPSVTEVPSPIVIFVHGGGWVTNDKKEQTSYAKGLQNAGITVFNINYREADATHAAFPRSLEDIEEAVRWAVARGPAFNGRPDRVFLVGGSAGGQLVAAVAIRMNATEPLIKGVVSLSGPFDVLGLINAMDGATPTYPRPVAPRNGEIKLLEHTQDALQCDVSNAGSIGGGLPACSSTGRQAFATLYSPSRQPIPTACKWLLFNSTEEIIPLNQVEAMKTHLEAEGKRVTFKPVPGEKHAVEYWTSHTEEGPIVSKLIFEFILAHEVEPSSSIGARTAATARVQYRVSGASTLGARSTAGTSRIVTDTPSSTLGARSSCQTNRTSSVPAQSSTGLRSSALVARTATVTRKSSLGARTAATATRSSTTQGASTVGLVTYANTVRHITTTTIGVRTSVLQPTRDTLPAIIVMSSVPGALILMESL